MSEILEGLYLIFLEPFQFGHASLKVRLQITQGARPVRQSSSIIHKEMIKAELMAEHTRKVFGIWREGALTNPSNVQNAKGLIILPRFCLDADRRNDHSFRIRK